MKTGVATCDLLSAAGMPLKILTPQQTTGSVPEETKRACLEADAVLFGAAGPATTAVVGWLRWEMEAWAVCGRRSSTRACARR
jgi:isocitrate/isopropylmalate dehydrogenase